MMDAVAMQGEPSRYVGIDYRSLWFVVMDAVAMQGEPSRYVGR